MNPLAIASLVTGVIGLFPLSIAFGIVALRQIKRTGQRGRGLAVTGLVLGVAGALAAATVIQLMLVSRDPAARPPLRAGDCVNGIRDGNDIATLPTVTCADPHEGEVFAVFEVPGTKYPGDSMFVAEAATRCQRLIHKYTTRADDKVGLYYLHPTEKSWEAGDREIVCIAIDTSGAKRTGSIKSSGGAGASPTPSPTR